MIAGFVAANLAILQQAHPLILLLLRNEVTRKVDSYLFDLVKLYWSVLFLFAYIGRFLLTNLAAVCQITRVLGMIVNMLVLNVFWTLWVPERLLRHHRREKLR